MAEAEGRALRCAIIELGNSLALIVIAMVLLLMGLGLLLWALYQFLVTLMVSALATLIVGLCALALAGLFGWIVQHRSR